MNRNAETLSHYIPIIITILTIIATLSFKAGEYYNELNHNKQTIEELSTELKALQKN